MCQFWSSPMDRLDDPVFRVGLCLLNRDPKKNQVVLTWFSWCMGRIRRCVLNKLPDVTITTLYLIGVPLILLFARKKKKFNMDIVYVKENIQETVELQNTWC